MRMWAWLARPPVGALGRIPVATEDVAAGAEAGGERDVLQAERGRGFLVIVLAGLQRALQARSHDRAPLVDDLGLSIFTSKEPAFSGGKNS